MCRKAWRTYLWSKSTSQLAVLLGVASVILALIVRMAVKGVPAMTQHLKENVLEAVFVGLLLATLVYCYQLFWAVPQSIIREAEMAVPPQLVMPRKPAPQWVYEPTPPYIDFSLTAMEAFTFEVIPKDFTLDNKKEYLLVLKNPGMQPAKAVNVRVQFPYLVEAHNVAMEEGVTGISFEPIGLSWTIGSIGGGGGHVEVKGCPATSSYRLHADAILPKGKAEILFILNSSTESVEETGGPPKAILQKWGPASFIHGDFRYNYEGRATKGSYYAPIEVGQDKIIRLARSRPPPHSLTITMVSDFLPAPCLSEKLVLPH